LIVSGDYTYDWIKGFICCKISGRAKMAVNQELSLLPLGMQLMKERINGNTPSLEIEKAAL
jgi:hypothetical protein